ncbi:hypothetical protein K8R78_08835 [bacterium]|nr:hypothetical protein [bacterium]
MKIIDCPLISGCPFYNNLRLPGSIDALKSLYCKLHFEDCARYKTKQRGEDVPMQLWPNGQFIGQR